MCLRPLLLVSLAGCGSVAVDAGDAAVEDIDGAGSRPPDAGDPATDLVLRFDFEAGIAEEDGVSFVPDAGGAGRRGLVRENPEGTPLLQVVPRDPGGEAGQALRFPAACEAGDPDAGPSECPRAILEVENSADQSPGARDFAVTVDLLVQAPLPSAVDDENVIQKGNFNDEGGQWKIQVDRQGRASCVFRYADDGGAPTVLRAERSLHDDAWHTVRCERRGGELRLQLDAGGGDDAPVFPIPPATEFSIENDRPIRIGGQDILNSSDQFHGALDNVRVEFLAP